LDAVAEVELLTSWERELDRVRRERRISRSLMLAELVETYLAQHDVQLVTIESSVTCSAKRRLCSVIDGLASSPRRRSMSGG
jgi:hypothetical protein